MRQSYSLEVQLLPVLSSVNLHSGLAATINYCFYHLMHFFFLPLADSLPHDLQITAYK